MSSNPITVLIVDDHPVIRDGLRALLEFNGLHVVGEAASSREAIALTRALRPRVILLDFRLPDGDGINTLVQIKRIHPAAVVLMLSIHTNPSYVARALQAGAAGYLTKDSDPEAIPRAIRAAVAGSPPG